MRARTRKEIILRLAAAPLLIYFPYELYLRFFPDRVFEYKRQTQIYQSEVIRKKIDVGTPKTLILGDSTAVLGYDASLFKDGLSLASLGGSPAEGFYSLNRYLAAYPPPECLVLTFSYNIPLYEDETFFPIHVMHGFYGFSELNELYSTGQALGDFPATKGSRAGLLFKAALYRLHLLGVSPWDVQKSLFSPEALKLNEVSAERLREQRGSFTRKRLQEGDFITPRQDYLNFRFFPSDFHDEYLSRIIRLAQSLRIRTYFVLAPVFEQALGPSARRFLNAYQRHLMRIMAQHSIPRFFFKPRPLFPEAWFRNATHLNRRGAEEFTDQTRDFIDCE